MLLLGGLHKSHLFQVSLPKEGQRERERPNDERSWEVPSHHIIRLAGWVDANSATMQ